MHAAALLAGASLLLATGCGSDQDQPDRLSPAAVETCSPAIDEQAGSLPPGVPAYDGAHLYRKTDSGGVTSYFTVAKGDAENLYEVRTALNGLLEVGGYRITDRQLARGSQSSLSFNGPHRGTVTVTPVCRDHLLIRYDLRS